MQNNLFEPVAASTTCPACHTQVSTNEHFCHQCTYPLKGTEQQQQSFWNYRETSYSYFETHKNQVIRAAKTLYWIAGLTFLNGLVYWIRNHDNNTIKFVLITDAVVVAMFIGLGFWSRKKPTAAIITGFCIYLLINVWAAINNPATLLQEGWIKVLIIGYLINGIKSSAEVDGIIKDHNFSG